MALLEVAGIGKSFDSTAVLRDISFDLQKGEALAIIGSSGSGKTTLLRCLNFLETADTGSITVAGETLWSADDARTQSEAVLRKKRLHFGLVFQNFNLFPQYTALQNVMLAGELLAKERPDYKQNRKQIHDELEAHARPGWPGSTPRCAVCAATACANCTTAARTTATLRRSTAKKWPSSTANWPSASVMTRP